MSIQNQVEIPESMHPDVDLTEASPEEILTSPEGVDEDSETVQNFLDYNADYMEKFVDSVATADDNELGKTRLTEAQQDQKTEIYKNSIEFFMEGDDNIVMKFALAQIARRNDTQEKIKDAELDAQLIPEDMDEEERLKDLLVKWTPKFIASLGPANNYLIRAPKPIEGRQTKRKLRKHQEAWDEYFVKANEVLEDPANREKVAIAAAKFSTLEMSEDMFHIQTEETGQYPLRRDF